MTDTSDYISLYDLIEWAKSYNNNNLDNAITDLINIIQEQKIDLKTYIIHDGIKPRISVNNASLLTCLKDIQDFADMPF